MSVTSTSYGGGGRPLTRNVRSVCLRSEYEAICGNRKDFGVLMPNMQKGQYRRYQRLRKGKEGVPGRSISMSGQTQSAFVNPLGQLKGVSAQGLAEGWRERVRSRGSERSKTKI